MEIEGTRIGSVGPHSHTPETFGDDSTTNGHASSYGDTMDGNHGSSELGAPIYSNESSEMSVTTESHDTTAHSDHSTTPHPVDGHYGNSGAQHLSGMAGGYDHSSNVQNMASLASMSSHMPHASLHNTSMPSSSIMSHMPQVQTSSGAGNGESNFGSNLSTSTQAQPSNSGTTSLASSSALTTSVGGSMLSTGIGKKIKILAKKPDPTPQSLASSASNPSSSIGMHGSMDVDMMNAHGYHLDASSGVEDPNAGMVDYYGMPAPYGYDSYGMPIIGGGYDVNGGGGGLGTPGGSSAAAAAARKRRLTPGEYDLSGSVELGVPATKKRVKMTGRGSRGAADAAYSPVSGSKRGGGTPGRGKRGGAVAAAGGSGAYNNAHTTPSGRRQPPIGVVSSRRDLEGTAMAVCYDAVVDLMERPEAPPFNQPVDAEALGIPNYHYVIKKPMDLRTVKDNVKRNYYRNAQDFVDDVRLIWSNAMAFNSADSQVHQLANTLNTYFEMRAPDIVARANALAPGAGMSVDAQTWAAIVASHSPASGGNTSATSSAAASNHHHGLGSSTRGAAGGYHQQLNSSGAYGTPTRVSGSTPRNTPTAAARPVRNDPKKAELNERIAALSQQVKAAENQLANLKKNGFNQALNRAIDALAQKPASRTFEVSDVSALPFPLKASLAHVLRTMNDIGHVREIVKILMQERFTFPRSGTDVYLEIDQLTPTALRRIEHYIRTTYPDGAALLETPAPDPPANEFLDDGSSASAANRASHPAPPRPSVSGPSAGTAGSSTDESMLVDVMGFDAPPTHSASASSSNHHNANAASSSSTSSQGASTNHKAATASSASTSAATTLSSSANSKSFSSHHGKSSSTTTKSHHAMLDESDSDTSDSDSDDDVVNSNVMLRTSTKVLDIVPVVPKEEEVVEVKELKNAQSWSSSFDDRATSTSTTPLRPTTPGSTSTTPGGHGTLAGGGSAGMEVDGQNSSSSFDASSAQGGSGGSGEGTSSWDAFRNLDAQNKQRDRERAELEDKARREREERDAAARAEEERKRKAAEEERNKAAEEEKAKRDAEIKARREAERAKREASSAEQGMDMMEQSSIMRDLEKEMRTNASSSTAAAANTMNANPSNPSNPSNSSTTGPTSDGSPTDPTPAPVLVAAATEADSSDSSSSESAPNNKVVEAEVVEAEVAATAEGSSSNDASSSAPPSAEPSSDAPAPSAAAAAAAEPSASITSTTSSSSEDSTTLPAPMPTEEEASS